jgi:pimeloyl-ACP methyl ester carboxylesterase
MRILTLLALSAAPILSAAPCITAAKTCTEWVPLAGGPARSLIYRTYSLTTRNDAITRALIIVHGAGRDADNYFRTGLAAAFLAGALDNTIVIAPRFASNSGGNGGGGCADNLDDNEVNWPCGGDSWRSGGTAAQSKLTSYDFTDEVLRKLARKEVFPNLSAIVVAGHSAGGQYVNRYEMANQVHEKLGVPVTYVASNPSSYAYLDASRPTEAAWAVSARAPGYVPAPAADRALFAAFTGRRDCTTYNKWPYGFESRTGYTGPQTEDQLKKQFAARPATYLLGELDILPLGGFDGSCSAMAQGPTRLARGEAFAKYANDKLGAHHAVVIVPLCGHNARCMFTAESALPLLFPGGAKN